MDPWSLWICRACGSVEPVDLWNLWICRARDLRSLSYWGCGSCIVDSVEPLLILLISLYKTIIGIINLDSKSINSCK